MEWWSSETFRPFFKILFDYLWNDLYWFSSFPKEETSSTMSVTSKLFFLVFALIVWSFVEIVGTLNDLVKCQKKQNHSQRKKHKTKRCCHLKRSLIWVSTIYDWNMIPQLSAVCFQIFAPFALTRTHEARNTTNQTVMYKKAGLDAWRNQT